MAPVSNTDRGRVFLGSIDDAADCTLAAVIAQACGGFTLDDDDECYEDVDGPTCFNCRARRWTPDGFTCVKGLLPG